MLELPPLSLYIHIPWCVRKCPYCDFNSHQANATLPEEEYVSAVANDLQFESERLDSNDLRSLQSIFIGGGTPSLFTANSISRILEQAENIFGFVNDIEITLEVNPGTAEAERFKDYKSSGVNRLSIGVQSFQDSMLRALGRIHTSEEAVSAISFCERAGFHNFNLDLMYGLPDQSVDEALADLRSATEMGAAHLSWYQLTIEPNTAFYSRPPKLPDDSETWDMIEKGIQILNDAGYSRYEVSAYCKDRKSSKHNLNYWRFGDYLGVGAGAHGKLSHSMVNGIVRNRKTKQPEHYMAAGLNREAARTEVSQRERPFEYLMNVLRLREGFTQQDFEKRTGVTFSMIAKQVEYLSAKNLLLSKDGRITTSKHGYSVLNSLLEEFL